MKLPLMFLSAMATSRVVLELSGAEARGLLKLASLGAEIVYTNDLRIRAALGSDGDAVDAARALQALMDAVEPAKGVDSDG